MFLITHAASAITAATAADLYRVKKKKKRLFTEKEYLLIGFCSLIPDLFWPDGYSFFDIGLTISHTLLFGIPVFLVLLAMSRIFYGSKSYVFKACVFWLAYLSHIAWDCVSGGKQLLYPLSSCVIGFSSLPITYWFVLDVFFLCLMTLSMWLLKRNSQEP